MPVYSTGRFARLDKGYDKHCSPVAITNLITDIHPELPGQEVFLKVADIGIRNHYYWNIKARFFGGTFDILTGAYLKKALKEFHINNYRVLGPFISTPEKIEYYLRRGDYVLLQMHFHPKYGFHHVLLCGMRNGRYLTMDGWRERIVLLDKKDLRKSGFYAVHNIF